MRQLSPSHHTLPSDHPPAAWPPSLRTVSTGEHERLERAGLKPRDRIAEGIEVVIEPWRGHGYESKESYARRAIRAMTLHQGRLVAPYRAPASTMQMKVVVF